MKKGLLILGFVCSQAAGAAAAQGTFVQEFAQRQQQALAPLIQYCLDEYNDHNYSAALQLCGVYENSGFARVHSVLGDLYYRGLGTAKNYERGIRYYQRAVAEGDYSAASKLAGIFLFDNTVERNETLGLAYLDMAEINNVASAVPISIEYRYSRNPSSLAETARKDFRIMQDFVREARDHEFYVHYRYLLSRFYLTGYGIKADPHTAVQLMEELDRDFKDPESQFSLAELYYHGELVPRDFARAVSYLEKISDSQSVTSGANYYYLGMIYRTGGDGIRADEPRAIDLLRKASGSGNAGAALELARIYHARAAKEPIYFKDAAAWCDFAVKLDSAEGYYERARLALETPGGNEGYIMAAVDLKTAAEKNYCPAYDLLGDLSRSRNDDHGAVEYYRKAIDCGSTSRYGELAALVLKGAGGEVNYGEFTELINLGMNRNDSTAYYISGIYHLNPPDGRQSPNIKVAMEDLRRAATLGNSDALYTLYQIYSEGRYTDKNIPAALDCLERAARLGSVKALTRKFKYYFEGNYVKADQQVAFDTATRLAAIDVKKGNYLLGQWYAASNDYLKARDCYQTAADAGSAEAMYELGMLYRENQQIEQDLFKSCSYFHQAEQLDYAPASGQLARCIYDIHNGEIREAVPYLEKVALNGDPDAIDKLINIYSNEDDPFHNNGELLKWIRVGAKFGYPNCLYLLGSSYLNGMDDALNVNPELGKKYLRLAMNRGSTPAAYELAKYYAEQNHHSDACEIYEKFSYSTDFSFMQNLALCYLNGTGKNLNIAEGERLLLKAYDSTRSQDTAYLLGELYSDEGNSRFFDLKKAVEWYLEAADGGAVAALERLGELYERKSSIQNESKSFFYYTKAMEAGSSTAYVKVSRDYYLGIGTTADYKKACDVAQEAVDLAIAEGNALLADCYLTGNGREQNFDTAAALLHDGVDKNSADSAIRLGKIYSEGKYVDPDIDFACKYFFKAVLRDRYHGVITRDAVMNFVDGNICYKDSLHAYVIFNILQAQNVDTGIKYHNEIARLVKLLSDRELKFAHQIISDMSDYDEQ